MEEEKTTITIDELMGKDYLLFDVRSPKEYEEYFIPGAKSLSIFTNEERAEIGTLYKQSGKEYAVERGLGIVAPKLTGIFQKIKSEMQNNPGKQVVIYCARGGMRSKSISQTMNLMGIECLQLIGGIRSYRKSIEQFFHEMAKNAKRIIVIEGHTGAMKTKLLEKLQNEDYPVINLEKLAGHRGSIFGGIGEEAAAQKKFESRLYERLKEIQHSPYLIIESESKRIGRVIIPQFLLEGKFFGTRIHVHIPFTMRVKHICEVYNPSLHKEQIEEAINKLAKRISPPIRADIEEAVLNNDYEKVVSRLLESYYDPKYAYAKEKYDSTCVDVAASTFEELYQKVKNEIDVIIN
ncbi:tRNA 2-selenouridine(34) synthase MnmH [Fictibacillus barbaricus]|uniref:tRNA 2-selenouridine synthase n=1 Tax=Fictibacillus barbaricus TaxID=182136 RepID=A0ABU1TYG0_9BACL|nr:tRNA 2-selenouridine(34) synthase MnmH [Fictibacillus barbaricus]MDR7072248.1 tRNA 2-selenouridine synthase [Fictibacillus barbaricus]